MNTALKFIKAADWIAEQSCKAAAWCVLIAVLVSAGNALVRYTFDNSSNAWLEIQWYLFAGMFLLAASATLAHNEHVRVDVVYGHRNPRTKAWIDLLGLIFFLMPLCLFVALGSWNFFLEAYLSKEMSANAGGLIRWPIKLLLPVGFALLALQGIAEIVKRIGFLSGWYAMDIHYERPLQ